MKRLVVAMLAAAAIAGARPAEAQTSSGKWMPFNGRAFLDAAGGAASVGKVGGLAGGEIGVRLSSRFDLFGEGFWIANAATKSRLDLVRAIGSSLGGSQGGSSSSDLIVPAAYGGVGVRMVLLRRGAAQVYGAVSGGGAHVAMQPVFTLAGQDVTAALSTYGIVLGRDLTGETTKPAFDATVGVRLPKGRWYIDGRAGAISIRTSGQPINVVHIGGALGLLF
jgi:hypothetical protein